MKEYEVEVCETLIRIVTVEAMNVEDAIKFVKYDYNNAELVLDSDDFFDVDFNVVNNDTTIK
jgi:hypothetical protein